MDALTEPTAIELPRRPDLRRLARWLAKSRVDADQVALIGFTFALFGAAALALSGVSVGAWRVGLLLLAAIALPLRLICTRLESLVATEVTKAGRDEAGHPIWSALFDRVADVALLAATGFAAVSAALTLGPLLGWTCAVLALLAAYLGERGRDSATAVEAASVVAGSAPLLILEAGIVVSIVEPLWRGHGGVLLLGLAVAAVWSLVRVIRLAGRLDRAARAPAAAAPEPGA